MLTPKSFFRSIARFFEPRELHVSVFYGDDRERLMIELDRPPRVVQVTDKLLRLWDPEAPMLEELGYEKYDRDVYTMNSYYARRPWLWLLRAWVGAGRAFWNIVSWTYGKIWYSTLDSEGRRLKWRDVRLGSGALVQARSSVVMWRNRAEKLHDEVIDLKREMSSQFQKGKS